MEMQRILREDGSIYLHCDPTASHYLKAMLDAIFGAKNFLSEIIWKYKYGGRSKKWFGRKHDVILFYRKSAAAPFYLQSVRIPHEPDSLEMNFTKVDENGRRYREGIWKSGKKYRYYADEGRTPDDVWSDINALHPSSRKRTGYPTEKPLELYERIIQASSKEGDWVLDPFCGCATTPIAAERLGRRWVGMDIWEKAYETVLKRLEQESLAGPELNREKPHLFTFGEINYTTVPPNRTDEDEVVAPRLQIKLQRAKKPWQKLSRAHMHSILSQIQTSNDGVGCAGCGRELEKEFLELDHIQPKSDNGQNFITNRVLLCSPCNRGKSDQLTMRGLHRKNDKAGWLKDRQRAKAMQDKAQLMTSRIQDFWDTPEIQFLIAKTTPASTG